MKIKFIQKKQVQWGEKIILLFEHSVETTVGNIFELEMQCRENDCWTAEIEFRNSPKEISYLYAIEHHDHQRSPEKNIRKVCFLTKNKAYTIIDNWQTKNGESPFYSIAFTNCFFKRNDAAQKAPANKNDIIFMLRNPQVEPDRHIAIVGNQDFLGNWDLNKKIRLHLTDFPVWSVALSAKDIAFPLEYKYLLVDSKTDKVIEWENGENRVIRYFDKDSQTIIHDENYKRSTQSWRGAGVAIPVFSLRSEDSFGVGEFNDLKKMIDWAALTNQRIIQTLPINDTTLHHNNLDSYPYNAVSVFALHPIYLNLDKIGKLKSKNRRDYYQAKKNEFNAKNFADYQNVMNVKWEFFKEIFSQESAKIFASDDYKKFFDSNKEWLIPYAAFSYLRNLYGSPDFEQWEKYQTYKEKEIKNFSSPKKAHYEKIALYYFVQYHLHKQLIEVHEYARAKGIALKGDIPIGVSPRSVDTWVDPQLFNTNKQAGAPPDDFSVTGQNWGFPTYNWELMKKDGYQWWKKRFQKLAEYFDAYRIDHILGFFRIWEIPSDAVWGLSGNFYPALPFSKDELEQRGIPFEEERMLRPYIKDHIIKNTFGQYADEVLKHFFVLGENGIYHFKPAFDTEKKIEAYFNTLENVGEKELLIRDGLYQLHCEVLFVRDTGNPDKFHPRISINTSVSFKELPENTQQNLYEAYLDFYYRRHNEFWKKQAIEKLSALINATKMLVCGEDLGMVPDTVPEVMDMFEILSLEIQRMPKGLNTEFAMPKDAPYLSVCTTSTHDMNPIRAWWEENPDLTQSFYNRALKIEGAAPKKCETWISEKIIDQHLTSPAILVILPWQDWMAISSELRYDKPEGERINVPANPHNFWCYRMHITLEELLKAKSLNTILAEKIKRAGR